jgi:uncharacterized protein YbjT (DUF2867 family)
MDHRDQKKIVVLGATGYVGSKLVKRLIKEGYLVRAAGRSIEKLKISNFPLHPSLEVVSADVLKPDSLEKVFQGYNTVYYFIHSMYPGIKDFVKTDRKAAENTIRTAASQGISRIIYLGGLGDENTFLSEHLRSRLEVGRILQSGSVPTTQLRCGVILGSGSASFEIIRYLVERLPVMITPRWVSTKCQPISIDNVLNYLVGCLDKDITIGDTYEIGGLEILSYRDLFDIYAEEAGLFKRLIIPIPLLTPRLSSYWISLVTPMPASIAIPLAKGLKNPVLCSDNRIRDIIPQKLLTAREAIKSAITEKYRLT